MMSKVAISTAVNQEAPQGGTGSEPATLSGADRLIFEQVKVAARAAEEKKAQGVLILRLSAITELRITSSSAQAIRRARPRRSPTP